MGLESFGSLVLGFALGSIVSRLIYVLRRRRANKRKSRILKELEQLNQAGQK